MYQQPAQDSSPRPRRFTLFFSLPALLVLCGLLAGTAQTPVANAVATSSQDLSPTERQRRVSKLVSNVIERSHYRQSPINDPVSALVLDRFLDQLDGSRSYFLASDVAEFERFRYQLDEAVVNGTLEPVFTMFNRFQVRNRERVAYALELLKTEPDFTATAATADAKVLGSAAPAAIAGFQPVVADSRHRVGGLVEPGHDARATAGAWRAVTAHRHHDGRIRQS